MTAPGERVTTPDPGAAAGAGPGRDRRLCESCGLRRPAGALTCPYCGTQTPEGARQSPPPPAERWRRLGVLGLLAVIAGALLPEAVGLLGDGLVLAGSIALVLYALRVTRGPR